MNLDYILGGAIQKKKKQKKLATLCHSKNIEVISASEELGHD